MSEANELKRQPASMLQQQFWFIHEISPSNSAHNIIVRFNGSGSLNLEAARTALAQVTARHESLRTTLESKDGLIVRVISREQENRFCLHDYGRANPESVSSIEREVVGHAQRPFDLSKGPLFRADLFLLPEEKFILLFVFHPAIMDEAAFGVFSREFAAFYRAALTGATTPAIPDAPQYSEHVEREAVWLRSETATELQAIWSRQMEGQSGILNLPTDYQRKSIRELKGDAVDLRFSQHLSVEVERFCESQGIEKTTLLLATLVVLFFKHTNQTDITMGVSFANRELPHAQNVLGTFHNVLPLPFEISPEQSLRSVIEQVRSKMELADKCQQIPLQNLLSAVKPSGSPGSNPIFQTAFVVNPKYELDLPETKLLYEWTHNGGAPVDLVFSLDEPLGDLRAHFEYDANLFLKETIQGLASRFENALARGIANPDLEIRRFDILGTAERRWLVEEVNQTRCEVPDIRLHELVAEQSQKTPDKVALMCGDRRLTYRDLNERSNQLARYLLKNNVQRNSLVGVYLYRSTDMMVAILAVLKCGAAYVPLDPKFPKDRLDYIVDVTKLPVLITQQALSKKLSIGSATEFCLDTDTGLYASESTQNLECEIKATDPAYVLFTSGSTGKPKGIAIHHEAVVNFQLSMAKKPGITPNDVLLAITTLSFDISILEMFLPLIVGASIVVATSEEVTNGEALLKLLKSSRATILQGTPTTWQILIAAGLSKSEGLKILCGGESLPAKLASQLCDISDDVWNMYGPTETTIWSSCCRVQRDAPVRISPPIDNTQFYIVDEYLQLVPKGVPGELVIGGLGVSYGYTNRPDLNETKFLDDPFVTDFRNRIYRTGDLARYHQDGSLEHLGRTDSQIKLRGFRIELSEIESAVSKLAGVEQCAVTLFAKNPNDKKLVAYVVMTSGSSLDVRQAREFLRKGLPDYMIPAVIQSIEQMPMTANGKIDRKRLPAPADDVSVPRSEARALPVHKTQRAILSIWETVLGTRDINLDDNFFEVGGTSLLAIRIVAELKKTFHRDVPIVTLFQYPTIAKLAEYFDGTQAESSLLADAYARAKKFRAAFFHDDSAKDGVAIVGMSGKFPGASDINQFWENLCNGVESISHFSLEELDPTIDEKTKNDPNYVPYRGIVEDADKFDARFFNISPLEAQVMDPQQRLFLEVAWAALENAGYTPDFPGLVGVYMGVGDNHYYPQNVLCHPDIMDNVGRTAVTYGNQKDYTAMRVAYVMNLTGPAMDANTACSSALLAVDNAYRALLSHECDMAIAGASEISVPQKKGHKYQAGGTFTIDGHCKPFDADATGTMFCDGVAAVVLRRLEDAIEAGDTIYAVIRGSAKNNDGSNKVSFVAPSVEGQAHVIAMAQAQANVHPEDVQLLEAHGTGTPLGDPIEIEGLTRAFRYKTDKKQFCYICSTKANIGHAVVAAGIASLIKAALCLHDERIPENLHFKQPNPKIDFENSPFKVVTELTRWPRGETPRFAGISCFGFGGTNVHTVISEAPVLGPSSGSRVMQLLRFSGKTEQALARNRQALSEYLKKNRDTNLADAAFTLDVGRVHHKFRDYVVCNSAEQAAGLLSSPKSAVKASATSNPALVFMFPGQGAQYVNMGRTLYEQEPVFRNAVDRCCAVLNLHVDRDIKEVLYPSEGRSSEASEILKDTTYTQPAIFTIQYALAQLWMSWGLKPSVVVGHSIGEFAGAVLAGVFSLDDALALVALRGKLMGRLPRGSMLSIPVAAAEIEARLPQGVQLAASNGPRLCVVAGPDDAIDAFAGALQKEGLSTTRLHTSHAFHSAMMAPIVDPFQKAVESVPRNTPSMPFISTCTGNWITEEEVMSAEYWARHLRMPVRFSEAISQLTSDGERVFLELGPRNVLTTLTRQHMDNSKRHCVIPSLGATAENGEEWNVMLAAVGELWRQGINVDREQFYQGQRRRRIPLPSYAFERKSYWLNPIVVDYRGQVQHVQQTAEPSTETVHKEITNDYTPGQRYLIQLWREVLGVEDITLDNDFFDLGGHSLVGMTMLTKMNERFGCSFILSDIISNPTIRQFAGKIEELHIDPGGGTAAQEPQKKEWSPLVALAPKGTNAPIFCVAGQGGHAMELLSLAKMLQPDIPFYGLEARGVAGHTPLESVEEMATEHIAAIRSVQPHGPYYLCGYSFGGLVAYEMALQLTAKNETIAWLGLLDTDSPLLPKRTWVDFRRVQLKRVLNNPVKYIEGMIHRRFLDPKLEGDYLAVESASIRAEDKYRPASYAGDVVLFRTTKGELLYDENFGSVIDDYNGWGTLVSGELTVIPVPGGHNTLLQETDNARVLAERIRENLGVTAKGERQPAAGKQVLRSGVCMPEA